ncbi:hypothetical protein [Methanococcoides sp. LMO-2]|uniref:Uncharacterized protein n=1 Tax=Methanococcoides cohabitans TaxID=3136559 RepID=A0ABU9KUW0_9EURY
MNLKTMNILFRILSTTALVAALYLGYLWWGKGEYNQPLLWITFICGVLSIVFMQFIDKKS